MRWMTIGQVARRMGLRASAIRYYERTGLLPKPERHSGQRRYDQPVLARLAVIRFAKHVGFRLTEIKRLLEGVRDLPPPERWRLMAASKAKQLATLAARARSMRKLILETLHHHCPHLEERGRALDDDKVPDTNEP